MTEKLINLLNDTILINKNIDVNIDDDLKIKLGLTSIKIIEFIFKIEEYFSIEFNEEDLNFENFKSLKEISMLIEKYIK